MSLPSVKWNFCFYLQASIQHAKGTLRLIIKAFRQIKKKKKSQVILPVPDWNKTRYLSLPLAFCLSLTCWAAICVSVGVASGAEPLPSRKNDGGRHRVQRRSARTRAHTHILHCFTSLRLSLLPRLGVRPSHPSILSSSAGIPLPPLPPPPPLRYPSPSPPLPFVWPSDLNQTD